MLPKRNGKNALINVLVGMGPKNSPKMGKQNFQKRKSGKHWQPPLPFATKWLEKPNYLNHGALDLF
jgi:hypothetical protein